ncbi:MAG: efflux RND transporter periplasmic adaptor subunit [Flavobacteriaceae bacterium]|nr:efflux RND transporter periplasmic adaptor subunit [Flavobacteriaceae bacterium]
MKKTLYILFISAILASCSNSNTNQSVQEAIDSGDLNVMVQKREQILTSYDSIGKLLSQLELAIAEKDTTSRYPLVTVFEVKDTVFSRFVAIQGNVETSENILIYPEYQGVLSQVYVKQGQQVNKGQTLAKIDDGGLSSQLAQLETQYELAKTTYERQQRLWDQQIGSEIQLLQAKTNMEASESAVKQLQSQLGKTTIRAPFSGVIDEIITEQGSVVGPGGMALMRLVNLSDMRVKAAVPENYLQSVAKGDPVKINFPAIQETVDGKISVVGSFINPTNRTFQVEVEIPNTEQKIKPNLMASLQINDYKNESALAIPSNCIIENAIGETFVYVLKEREGSIAQVERTQIETGKKNNGFVEVLNGLSNEDVIVQGGALTLKDGARITIQSAN